jgi:hypothetical protein
MGPFDRFVNRRRQAKIVGVDNEIPHPGYIGFSTL